MVVDHRLSVIGILHKLGVVDITHHSVTMVTLMMTGYSIPSHWIPIASVDLCSQYIEIKPRRAQEISLL